MSYPYLSDLLKAITGYDLPLPLPMFGLFVALAMLAAGDALRRRLREMGNNGQFGHGPHGAAPEEIVPTLTVVVMIAGVFGARLFHILEHTDAFLADPAAMIFTRSGLTIFGGLIVGTLAGVICLKRWKLPVRPMLDAVAPAMMLGYAIGRIGCQVSGDGDWGIAANMALRPEWLPSWLWAQTYQNNIAGVVISAPGVYPTPLYEALMGFACFALLWSLRRHRFQIGWLFSIYLLLAGAERLLIEQIRINPVLGGLHATQAEMISIALIAIGLAGSALLIRRRSDDAAAPAATSA